MAKPIHLEFMPVHYKGTEPSILYGRHWDNPVHHDHTPCSHFLIINSHVELDLYTWYMVSIPETRISHILQKDIFIDINYQRIRTLSQKWIKLPVYTCLNL